MAQSLPVEERPRDLRRWLAVHGPRTLVASVFLSVHVIGGLYALDTLRLVWRFRLLLRLTIDDNFVLRLLHLPWFTIPAMLAAVVLLAIVTVGATVRRWWRAEAEPDTGLRLRVLVYALVGCVFCNALVASTPESFAGPFRVRLPILNVPLSVAFAYGGYAAWSLLLPRLRRLVRPGVRRGLDILAMNFVLLVILGELGLRVLAAVWTSPILVTASTPSQIRRQAGRLPPGSIRYGFPMNRGGHYDTEFATSADSGKRIVASIGDSYAYGVVPHSHHFTTVAERQLGGVAIYNMGYPGTSPPDYLFLLRQDALPLKPDLVVIQLFLGNDVDEGPGMAGPARWYDGDSWLLAVVFFRWRIMRRAELAPAAAPSGEATSDATADFPWLTDPAREEPHLGNDIYLQLETRNARSIGLPDEAMYQRFFQELTAIKWVARTVPVGFVLIPDEFQVEDEVWRDVLRQAGQPLDRDLAQRTILAWLREKGWPVLDLLPALRAVEPMADGRRHLYHLRDTHFNARGNEVAGRALGRFVDSLLKAEPAEQAPVTAVPLPLHLAMGDSAARGWMQAGWHAAEGEGRRYAWSDGEQSVLAVPLPRGGDIRMDFEVLPFEFRRSPQQRITVVVNGAEIAKVELRQGMQRYSVILPAAALSASMSTLEFNYAWARTPQELGMSGDVRQLAVAWYGIDFAPVGP